jgi:uncharacterized protein YfaS (alpha-2-macroglobulin family)
MSFKTRLQSIFNKLKRNKTPAASLEVTADRLTRSQFTSRPSREGFQNELLERLMRERHKQAAPHMAERSFFTLLGIVRTLTAVPVVASVLVVAVFVSSVNWQGVVGEHPISDLFISAAYASDNFSIDATVGDRLGVASSTAFVVKSKQALNPAELRSALHIVPAIDFQLQERSAQEFVVQPVNPLAPRTLYRIMIDSNYVSEGGITIARPFSFAFEVKEKVRVISTFPGDKTNGVPVKSGIEISLSHDGMQNVEEALTITPDIAHVVQTKGRKIIIKPTNPLKYGTIYTVTLSKKLQISASKETLNSDYSFAFETERANASAQKIYLADRVAEFTPEQKPTIPVYVGYKQTLPASAQVVVYRFPSAQAYVAAEERFQQIPYWSSYLHEIFRVPTSSLKEVARLNATFNRAEYSTSLQFPTTLPLGWYVGDVTIGTTNSQLLFQVTPWGVFTTVAASSTVVWVNNLTKGTVGANLPITNVSGTLLSTTNDQGLALISPEKLATASSSLFSQHSVLVGSGNEAVAVTLNADASLLKFKDSNLDYSYWQYIYTDRDTYQPGDTANVWGFIKSRDSSVSAPTEVRLVLSSGVTDWYGNSLSTFEIKVPVVKGVFNAALPLGTLTSGYYQVTVYQGDTVLNQHSITIQKYEKPALTLSLKPSKYVIHTGEPFSVVLGGSFFDGTPAANVPVEYELNQQKYRTTLNAQGKATVTLVAPNGFCSTPKDSELAPSDCYLPKVIRLSARPTVAEYGTVEAETSLNLFGSQVYLSVAGQEIQPHVGEVSSTLYALDTRSLEDGTKELQSYGQAGKPNFVGVTLPGQVVEGVIQETLYRQVSVGQTYNEVTKQMQDNFITTQSTSIKERFSLLTDGEGRIHKQFPMLPGGQYQVFLRTLDAKGFPEYARIYIYGYSDGTSVNYYSPYGGLGISVVGRNQYAGFSMGETVHTALSLDGTSKPFPAKGRTLFLRSNGSSLDAQVVTTSTYSFTFSPEDIPSTYVMAAWFNGKDYQNTDGPLEVYYKKEDHNLNVSVAPTKSVYAPGDMATINVKTQDASGHGVSAAVNLNVVDEAYYALNPESASPLDSLYRSLGNPFSAIKRSHEYLKMQSSDAAGRGGGGDGERTNFADTAATVSGFTDDQGVGTFTIKLPDNITAWRITAQGITETLLAGASTTPLIVTKPAFVQASVAPEYVAGDQPSIAVRAYGSALKETDRITLGFSAPLLNQPQLSVTTVPFNPWYVQLPRLSPGTYDTHFSLTSDQGTDKVGLPIKVVASRQREQVQKDYVVEKGIIIKGNSTSPTLISIMDQERSSLYSPLLSLVVPQTDRFDDRLAADIALQLGKKYFGEAADPTPSEVWQRYEAVNGGLAIYPYGGVDPYLTMLASQAATDRLDTSGLKSYWYGLLNSENTSREVVVQAFAGLASLNEPVLVPIRSLAAVKDLTLPERVYLGLAAARAGDDTLARSLYHDITEHYSTLDSDNRFLKVVGDINLSAQLSAVMAILGARLNETDRVGWWTRLQATPAPYAAATFDLEKALYLTEALPYLKDGEQSFTALVNGTERSYTIPRGGRIQLSLNASESASLQFVSSTGKLSAVAHYEQPLSSAVSNAGISIERQYLVNGVVTSTFAVGDVVEVRLLPRFETASTTPDMLYQLTDILPSGLVFVGDQYSWNYSDRPLILCGGLVPYGVDGQEVKFGVSKKSLSSANVGCSATGYITYHARVRGPGTFMAEPALLQSFDKPAIRAVGSAGEIRIPVPPAQSSIVGSAAI